MNFGTVSVPHFERFIFELYKKISLYLADTLLETWQSLLTPRANEGKI